MFESAIIKNKIIIIVNYNSYAMESSLKEKTSISSDKINFNIKNHRCLEVISFNEENEYILSINFKLKYGVICDFCNKNLEFLILICGLIIILTLIFFQVFAKTKLYLDIFSDGKIYYRNERKLDLNKIKKQIQNYKKFKILFDNQHDFIKREKPKISLIMTIYNQAHFLNYIYSSIQQQIMKEIEIIIIDDASTDNSSKIINSFMKIDKRIIYLKNKINKGAFYSRNEGVMLSKGEYILIIDPDDLLLNNILVKAYENAKYYDLDILQYYVIRGSYQVNKIWLKNKYKSGILYSKQVKEVFFYSVSRTLWDKLIKRDTFIKGIFFMKQEFNKERYFIHSDDTIFWGIISSANSYGFLEQIGYFYNFENPNSLIHHYFDPEFINIIFHSLFSTLKYYYIQTEDNEIEKNYVGYKFFIEKVYYFYSNKIGYLTRGFDYVIDVLNMYINCSFFNLTQKIILNNFRNLIIKRKYTING